MNASHSWLVIFKCACESAIGLPVYFCGPPLAQHTISVTRYLNPAGGTRWCGSPHLGVPLWLGDNLGPAHQSSTSFALFKRRPQFPVRRDLLLSSLCEL